MASSAPDTKLQNHEQDVLTPGPSAFQLGSLGQWPSHEAHPIQLSHHPEAPAVDPDSAHSPFIAQNMLALGLSLVHSAKVGPAF